MKKLLIAAVFVGMPLVGCTKEVVVIPAPGLEATPGETPEGTDPAAETPDAGKVAAPTSGSTKPEDRCLDGQDMDGADVDVTSCPAIPEIPQETLLGKDKVSLGAWEIGTTAEGDNYKYGTLSAPGTATRTLSYEGGTTEVNALNLECWAKGYYRLRKILQDPPPEYLALYKAKFQFRFFQFQTDLRNGPSGYKEISSFQDHLVKWVTVISAKGVCEQPTYKKLQDYSKAELTKRGLPQPK